MVDFDVDYDVDADNVGVETVEVSAESQQIRQLLKVDGEFFIEFFLAEELTSPVPKFHTEVWQLLTNTALPRVLLAIPRDHAKTTLSKLCVVWYYLFTSHRFCVYLSNTNTIAKNACRDIINYLKSQNFRALYGDIKIVKDSETESLWIFELPLGNGKTKKCILRAIGANQQMRGINIDNQRPDIAVVDDVEDNENTESPVLQKKLDRWIFGPFIKALARQKKIIWLGNMLQKTSLLARLSKNPKWNPVVFGAIVTDSETGEAVPLWPERWPMQELLDDFAEYRSLNLTATWLCEMMNMPGHTQDGFTADSIYYLPRPTPDQLKLAFITIDPAFGEDAVSDKSAVVVHGITETGVPMVVDFRTGRYDEHELFRQALELAVKWRAYSWGIEAVAAQKVLISFFRILLAARLMDNRVIMLPLTAGRGDPKVARIKAWVSLMAMKEYAVFEDDLEVLTQMLAYNMKKKSNDDDLLDACAYGPQMLNEHRALIANHYAMGMFTNGLTQQGGQIEDV